MFNFTRKGQIKPNKEEDNEEMLVPASREENVPIHVDSKDKGGNGSSLVDSHLITVREPFSIGAEQYRVLCTRISQIVQSKPSYILAVTSSAKEEGKSVTSLNLAISMAKDFDEKVLLIEGDLKNPSLHEYLKHPPGLGLSDVLEGRIDFTASSTQMFEGYLTVIFAGKITSNPSRLLSSPKMQEILNTARGYYKYIIIDTPPIIPLADINIYSTLVDGFLLVIRAGRTPRSIVKKALSTISSEKVIGAVLNDVEGNYSGYYYGRKYSY